MGMYVSGASLHFLSSFCGMKQNQSAFAPTGWSPGHSFAYSFDLGRMPATGVLGPPPPPTPHLPPSIEASGQRFPFPLVLP